MRSINITAPNELVRHIDADPEYDSRSAWIREAMIARFRAERADRWESPPALDEIDAGRATGSADTPALRSRLQSRLR